MSKNGSASGINILSLLGVAFVVLKLTNLIDWSWWYVLLPFWIGLPIAGVVFLCVYLYFRFKN